MAEPTDLLARALDAPADSAERILFTVAAFDGLVDDDVVLVGGGAQVTHTGVGRLTDIDLVGVLGDDDERRLEAAGFRRQERHWVYATDRGAVAVELPGSALGPEETFELVAVDGAVVRVIAATDLMMDRLLQATDGTAVTHDEAAALATAAGDRIDWEALAARARRLVATSDRLARLPDLVAELRR